MKHRYFERIVMTLIVLSSIKLAFDTYIMDADPESFIVNNFILILNKFRN